MRNCHIHETLCEDNQACPDCVEAYKSLPDANTMTGDERVAELEAWCGTLEIEFSLVHRRIEALVGRPVWTHEMGTGGMLGLMREARMRAVGSQGTGDRG